MSRLNLSELLSQQSSFPLDSFFIFLPYIVHRELFHFPPALNIKLEANQVIRESIQERAIKREMSIKMEVIKNFLRVERKRLYLAHRIHAEELEKYFSLKIIN